MSGPLARSAHMRMKMKREKGGTPRPSPRCAPISPAQQTVAKELLLAVAVAAAATSSTEEMKMEDVIPEQAPHEAPALSPSSEASRARSKSRPRVVRGGINSLETEGDLVVDMTVSPSAAGVARGHNVEIPMQRQSKPHSDQTHPKQQSPSLPAMSPQQRQQLKPDYREQQEPHHYHNSPLPPAPVSPSQQPPADFANRQHGSFTGNNQLSPTATTEASRPLHGYDSSFQHNEHHQYDFDQIRTLQIEESHAMQMVRLQDEVVSERHGQHFSGDINHSFQSGNDGSFNPFASSPVTVPNKNATSPCFEDANFETSYSPPLMHHQQNQSKHFEQRQHSPRQLDQHRSPRQFPQQQKLLQKQSPRQYRHHHHHHQQEPSPWHFDQQQEQQPPRSLEHQQSPHQQQNYFAKRHGAREQTPQNIQQPHFSQIQPQPSVSIKLPQRQLFNVPPEDDDLNVYSPNHKDGSQMMTIEGNDDFVYCDSNNPEYLEQDQIHTPDEDPLNSDERVDGGADLEYHTNADEEYQRGHQVPPFGDDSTVRSDKNEYGRSSSNQTVDSDQALTGTPIRKKETSRPKKKRHSKKEPKFMIENVGSADSLDGLKRRSDPRYAIHNSWSHEEEGENSNEENQIPQKRNVRGHSHKYNEIVATVKRYEDIEDVKPDSSSHLLLGKVNIGSKKHKQDEVAKTSEKEALSPVERHELGGGDEECSDSRKVVLPQRIGLSRSWDSSKVDETRALDLSKSWDAPSESGNSESHHHGWRNTPTKKQRNLWDSDEFDDDNNKSPLRHRQFIGASKSWDWNNSDTPGAKGNPEFVQWDKAGEDWDVDIKNSVDAPSDRAPKKQENEDLDRNAPGAVKMPDINIPYELDTGIGKEQVSDYDDDDSIFAFEKKEREKRKDEPPPLPVNPQDIFAKINKGLKQADNAKNRALRGDSMSTAGSDYSGNLSEPESQQSKPVMNKNVVFAKEKDNTIHTYLVEESPFHSESTNFESNDDEGEREEEDAIHNDERAKSASPTHSNRIASPMPVSSQSKGKSLSTIDGVLSERKTKALASVDKVNQIEQIAQKKKTVRYQSDEDTYYTNEESTFGSSFKSSRSGVTVERQKELSLLQHVDIAMTAVAASLGGLLGSPPKADDEKSLATDQDDNTNGQSTLLSDATSKQPGDWFGYVERVLFPPNDAETNEGDRSVVTENECSESQYTESVNTESMNAEFEAKSKYSDYGDSCAEEEEDEDEAYLLQQALAAARAVHHIHDVEYDETKEIDVLTDVKFHVVNVKLPLGLLFQEHEIGAWVSRVVPDGNGARKGVQHGDQLAAINGKSAVHASIDEVAATISRTPQNQGVELTFLRYIGPLRPMPGAIVQEGFEVTDKSVNKIKHPPRPPKSQPRSPSKTSPKFFKTKSPPTSPKQRSRNKSRTENPPTSPSSTEEQAPSSSSSPRKMDEVDPPDNGGNGNSRSNLKKKTVLSKMMIFKKKK